MAKRVRRTYRNLVAEFNAEARVIEKASAN